MEQNKNTASSTGVWVDKAVIIKVMQGAVDRFAAMEEPVADDFNTPYGLRTDPLRVASPRDHAVKCAEKYREAVATYRDADAAAQPAMEFLALCDLSVDGKVFLDKADALIVVNMGKDHG